jgi:hypothetical protein
MKRSLKGASLEEAGCAVRRPFVRRQARPGWVSVDFAELWHYRELLLFQVLRGIKVRYKQTALGAAWAILQPVLTMAAFTIFFGRLAGVPSDGVPYPIGGCTLPYSEAATIGRFHRYCGGCIAHADFALDASPPPASCFSGRRF